MSKSNIEWTDDTLNPGIYGCTRFGVGCDNCYAIEVAAGLVSKAGGIAKKAGKPNASPYIGASDGEDWLSVKVGSTSEAVRRILAVPKARDGKPRKVFVTSMADILHEDVPTDWIVACIEAMSRKPDHIWQVLTKRGHRWPEVAAAVVAKLGAWPRNVWAGLSVAHQPDTRLIPHLLKVPAAMRFLSVEPLVGPVDLTNVHTSGGWEGGTMVDCLRAIAGSVGGPKLAAVGGMPFARRNTVDWVIVGGESGPNARPMHPAWVRSLRDQCVAAGVPFFFKQWGEWAPSTTGRGVWVTPDGSPPPEWIDSEGPIVLMDKVGKKAAGRLLDGVEWSGVPNG